MTQHSTPFHSPCWHIVSYLSLGIPSFRLSPEALADQTRPKGTSFFARSLFSTAWFDSPTDGMRARE